MVSIWYANVGGCRTSDGKVSATVTLLKQVYHTSREPHYQTMRSCNKTPCSWHTTSTNQRSTRSTSQKLFPTVFTSLGLIRSAKIGTQTNHPIIFSTREWGVIIIFSRVYLCLSSSASNFWKPWPTVETLFLVRTGTFPEYPGLISLISPGCRWRSYSTSVTKYTRRVVCLRLKDNLVR